MDQLMQGFGLGGAAFGLICAVVSVVAIIPITIGSIFLVRRMFGPDKNTLQTGIPAHAKILQVGQTGMYINNQPQAALTVEVTPQDGSAPYQTVIKMVIPMVNIPSFQPGAVFPAKINQKDRNKVVLDVYG